MSKLTLSLLQRRFWGSADLLRESIDSGYFTHYILGLLFDRKCRLAAAIEQRRRVLSVSSGEEMVQGKNQSRISEEHLVRLSEAVYRFGHPKHDVERGNP